MNITPLINAIERLQEGLQRFRQDESDTQIRDGLIQRFEFTYETCHKTLKRYLEQTSPNPEQIDRMPFQDLIRTANEQGLLLGDWLKWKGYREMRGKSSHTYDEDIAIQVVAGIPEFLQEALFLRDQLNHELSSH